MSDHPTALHTVPRPQQRYHRAWRATARRRGTQLRKQTRSRRHRAKRRVGLHALYPWTKKQSTLILPLINDDDDVYDAGEDDDNKKQWKPSLVPCAESQVWLDTACCQQWLVEWCLANRRQMACPLPAETSSATYIHRIQFTGSSAFHLQQMLL